MSDNNIIKDEGLDQLFSNAETQKSIPLSDGAWNRLDEMMTNADKPSKLWLDRKWLSIAAGLVILVVVFSQINKSDSAYSLEELPMAQVESIYNNNSSLAELHAYHRKTAGINSHEYDNSRSKLIVVN